MFKSVVKPSILTFVMIFLFINLFYGITHYSFGSVVIPEWYIKENERYLFEPMPVMPFVYYWIKRGLLIGFVGGVIAFVLIFIVAMHRYRKSKDSVLCKDEQFTI